MLHAQTANIRCDRYRSNFLEVRVELNKTMPPSIDLDRTVSGKGNVATRARWQLGKARERPCDARVPLPRTVASHSMHCRCSMSEILGDVHATPAGSVQRELTRGLFLGHSTLVALVPKLSAPVEYDRSPSVDRWLSARCPSRSILQTAIGQCAGLQGIRGGVLAQHRPSASMFAALRCAARLAGLGLLASGNRWPVACTTRLLLVVRTRS